MKLKTSKFYASIAAAFIVFSGFTTTEDKLVSKSGHISFFSHTVAEDIRSNNYKVTSTLDTKTGEVVFSVPMQSFEFEKALMQQHFNSDKFLDTKAHPRAKFVGRITNLAQIDFERDGRYPATVEGELTIKGVSKQIAETGSITVEGGKITVNSNLKVSLADHGIAFSGGKPSTNVAKVIEVSVVTEYAR